MDQLMDMVGEFGPLFGMMFFFVWRDWKREEKLEERNTKLNDFIRTEFADIVEKNTEALRYGR